MFSSTIKVEAAIYVNGPDITNFLVRVADFALLLELAVKAAKGFGTQHCLALYKRFGDLPRILHLILEMKTYDKEISYNTI
jgi:hypothetical protein